MNTLLPSLPVLWAFVIASLILAITPGPGVIYIVTRSLAEGKRAGLASVAGVALGNFGNAMAASVGLTAIFSISSIAFAVVTYVGAAYLVYLGVSVWMTPHRQKYQERKHHNSDRAFRDGLIVALLNPKTAIFFAAFLPQFVDRSESSVIQTLLLGSIFVFIAASADTFYALAAGVVAQVLNKADGVRRLGRIVTGSVFVGLGVLTALGGLPAGENGIGGSK